MFHPSLLRRTLRLCWLALVSRQRFLSLSRSLFYLVRALRSSQRDLTRQGSSSALLARRTARCRNACPEHTLRPRAPPRSPVDPSLLDDTSSNNEPRRGLRHFGIIDANHPARRRRHGSIAVLDSFRYLSLLRAGMRENSRGLVVAYESHSSPRGSSPGSLR